MYIYIYIYIYILTLHPAKTSYQTLFSLWLLFSHLLLDNDNIAVVFFILNTRDYLK